MSQERSAISIGGDPERNFEAQRAGVRARLTGLGCNPRRPTAGSMRGSSRRPAAGCRRTARTGTRRGICRVVPFPRAGRDGRAVRGSRSRPVRLMPNYVAQGGCSALLHPDGQYAGSARFFARSGTGPVRQWSRAVETMSAQATTSTDGESAKRRGSRTSRVAGQDGLTPDLGTPVRGALELVVGASSPQTTAGADFSVFVIVRNPFEIPITLYRVESHIPVELMDMNCGRIEKAKISRSYDESSQPGPARRLLHRVLDWWAYRKRLGEVQSGVAMAVGTEFAPAMAASAQDVRVMIEGSQINEKLTVGGTILNFPENPTAEELDVAFGRLKSYLDGTVPTRLEPWRCILWFDSSFYGRARPCSLLPSRTRCRFKRHTRSTRSSTAARLPIN